MNPYKILLVEDDAEISEMLKNYLETENYEVACALDGQQACAMFDDTSYDLVLLDLMIPKISGMGVMKHIRQSSFVPIIILSAKDSESDKTLGIISRSRSPWWRCLPGSRLPCEGRCSMTERQPGLPLGSRRFFGRGN